MIVSEWPQCSAVIQPSTPEKQWKYNPTRTASHWAAANIMNETHTWHDCHLLCLQRRHPLKEMETRDVLSVTCSSFCPEPCDTFWPCSRLFCSLLPELILNPPLHTVIFLFCLSRCLLMSSAWEITLRSLLCANLINALATSPPPPWCWHAIKHLHKPLLWDRPEKTADMFKVPLCCSLSRSGCLWFPPGMLYLDPLLHVLSQSLEGRF